VPQLTIIIPYHRTFGSQHLEETILSVLENRGDDSEIFVLTDGSYRDPYSLSGEEVTFFSLLKANSLVQCVNAGIEVARAPVTCVLLPGTLWESGSLAQILEVFEDRSVAFAIPILADRNRQGRVFSTGGVCRPSGSISNYKPGRHIPNGSCLVPHQAAAFFRSSILQQIGGLLPQFCLQMAYADLGFLVEQLGLQAVELPTSVRFSGLPTQKVFASPFEQAKQCELLYRLWRHIGNTRQNQNQHIQNILNECWRTFPGLRMFRQLAGRLSGALTSELPVRAIHQRRMQAFSRDESQQILDPTEISFGLKIFDSTSPENVPSRGNNQKVA